MELKIIQHEKICEMTIKCLETYSFKCIYYKRKRSKIDKLEKNKVNQRLGITRCHRWTWGTALNFSFSVPAFVNWELSLVYHMNDVMFELKSATNSCDLLRTCSVDFTFAIRLTRPHAFFFLPNKTFFYLRSCRIAKPWEKKKNSVN